MSAELRQRIIAIGRESGLDAVGITTAEPLLEARDRIDERKGRGLHDTMWFTYGRPERSTDPSRIIDGAKSIVVGAMGYHIAEEENARPADGGQRHMARVARYAWEPFYRRLTESLGVVAAELNDAGWQAEVVVDDNRLVDRAVAYRAGLGWFGKNTNLLLDGVGSWFVLGSVVTDCVLEPAGSPVPDGCGTCTRCQVACPTGALDEAGVLDARKCLAWLVQASGAFPSEHREALGDRIYGCDECQDVCPPNTRQVRIGPKRSAGEDSQVVVDVLELLAMEDDALMQDLGHWYVPRRRPEYLRRNALVVLGNIGDPRSSSVEEALIRCLGDDSGVVRSHAVWAARRLGRDELVQGLSSDPDPMVVAELEADVEPVDRARV